MRGRGRGVSLAQTNRYMQALGLRRVTETDVLRRVERETRALDIIRITAFLRFHREGRVVWQNPIVWSKEAIIAAFRTVYEPVVQLRHLELM